jgi:predicted secreted protein
MSWIGYLATFFIAWWFFLFLVLPFGLRTQDEDNEVTLGTVPSAPRGPHMRRAALWTTLITLIFIGVLYGVVDGLGLGFENLPRFVPD